MPEVEKCEAAGEDESQASFSYLFNHAAGLGAITVFHLHDLLIGNPCLPSLGPCLDALAAQKVIIACNSGHTPPY